METYDDLNNALDWHAERALEIYCELECQWRLTDWFVTEGHALYRPQVC